MNINLIGLSGRIGSGKDTVGRIIQMIDINYDNATILKVLENPNANQVRGFFEIKKFAGVLKQMVAMLLSCKVSDLENEEFKSKILGKEWHTYTIREIPAVVPFFKMGVRDTDIIYSDEEQALKRSLILQDFYGDGTKFVVETNKMTPRKLLQLLGTNCGRNILHPNIWINTLFTEYESLFDFKRTAYPNWIITDLRFPNEAEAIQKRYGSIIQIVRGTDKRHSKEVHISEKALDGHMFDAVINNNSTLEALIEKTRTTIYNLDI